MVSPASHCGLILSGAKASSNHSGIDEKDKENSLTTGLDL
jgi:hypothetical protein